MSVFVCGVFVLLTQEFSAAFSLWDGVIPLSFTNEAKMTGWKGRALGSRTVTSKTWWWSVSLVRVYGLGVNEERYICSCDVI